MNPQELLQNQEAFKKIAKDTFDRLDLDKNGEIDINELSIALSGYSRSIGGPDVDQGIVEETMKSLDKDNSNTLTLDEFESYMKIVLIGM